MTESDILVVDHRPEDLDVVAAVLTGPRYRLTSAHSGAEALTRLAQHDYAVILLDLDLPDMDGLAVAAAIGAGERSRLTPIVLLTASSDVRLIARAYAAGAVDYLAKPIDGDILRAKVRVFAELFDKNLRRYHNLAEAIPQIVWTARPDGELDYCNARWVALTGLQLEASRGWGWLAALPAEDAARVQEAWLAAVGQQRTFEAKCRLRTAGGELRWHLGRAVPERDDSGALVGWLGTYTDFDDLERAEAEAKASSWRTHHLAEAGALLSSSLDARETVAKVAHVVVPAVADWCTVALIAGDDELAGVDACAHTDPARLATLRALIARFPPGCEGHAVAARVLRAGRGELVTSLEGAGDDELRALLERAGCDSAVLAPLRARARLFGVITLASAAPRRHDAADLALAEELARRIAMALDNMALYRAAQHAVEARDEFLSIASHELRTPLTALQLNIQRLERLLAQARGSALALQAAELTGAALRQTRRLGKLVEELLDVSRIATAHLELQLEPVELVTLVREVVERHREQAERAGCDTALWLATPVVGFWDRLRLEQVLTNLYVNALKYAAGALIEISVTVGDDEVALSVRDHGPGIPAADLTRIFERFTRAVASRHDGGLGMGLYIARQIVEAHGGRMRVDSVPGPTTGTVERGACFQIWLPRHPRPPRSVC